jgi:hypothetical protein
VDVEHTKLFNEGPKTDSFFHKYFNEVVVYIRMNLALERFTLNSKSTAYRKEGEFASRASLFFPPSPAVAAGGSGIPPVSLPHR